MKSEDVVVSSPELFLELVEECGRDPCRDKEQMRFLLKQQSVFEK